MSDVSEALAATMDMVDLRKKYEEEKKESDRKTALEHARWIFDRYKDLPTSPRKKTEREYSVSCEVWTGPAEYCEVKRHPPGNGHDQYPPKLTISSKDGETFRVVVSGNYIGYYSYGKMMGLQEMDELVVAFVIHGESPVDKLKGE